MATYVMSDIHGEYKKYRRMLEIIDLTDEDELFILGDVVDRGPEPMDVLRDMMGRPNVFPLFGNHDYIALDMLRKLGVEITEDNFATHITPDIMNELLDWMEDGGQTTMEAFRKLSREEQADVLDYLETFSLCEVIDVGENTFVLVHAGLGNYEEGRRLRDYSVVELICMRPDFNIRYFNDDTVFVVTGHTPTLAITGKAEIYHSHNNICIDCGAHFNGGRLACLCLDTMEEFYV